ncbi:CO2 hydration protein [Leptodesmis sichuanensis]|uniref:CO2 hydration protein n=1 Tax=Leptodesmis sichuanensis TaxID=2906798 RepID=UPI001F3E8E69|nr:CO2 hydration protein [Leptodesmis sichuanensis]UIE37758.1 CO2 hydration protein [Leptodesmis sichuanensis A121]
MNMATTAATKLPPSNHPLAEVIHRLEAGGSMVPDTPENLMKIIGMYKAYSVPMDFYWRDLLYLGERVFIDPLPFFKYLPTEDYWKLHNHYAGDDADLRIWRGGAEYHPELKEFLEKGEMGKMPRLLHHLLHDRINMEFSEDLARAMMWHRMSGKLEAFLDSEEYINNANWAIVAYLKANPLYTPLLALHKLFPQMFLEQARMATYMSILGLFWEIMAPVFFEMSDRYDEGSISTVPEAMDFLVNGIFAIAGRPIYHHVYIKGECYEIIPKSKGFMWLYEAAWPYVEAVFYRTAPFRGTKSYNAQANEVPSEQIDFHYGILFADKFPVGTAGIPPTLLHQDMYHFLPPYLKEHFLQNCRGEDDILVQLGIAFQRSMYNVTSAVLQATRAALLYPLDDPNPRHLQANRDFFEAQMDRFIRPQYGIANACRIRMIQTDTYK